MTEKTTSVSQDDRIWGALSYFWIISLVALAARKDNPYVRFHANQGALLFVLSFIGLIPVLGWLLNLAVCVMAILGIVKAYQGEKWELPLLAKPAVDFGNWIITTFKI